jgi:hypothetical protein
LVLMQRGMERHYQLAFFNVDRTLDLTSDSPTMPPLPRNLDSQVVAEIDSVTRRLRDLEEYQIPALRACTGPLVKQQQLNAGIRDDLDMCAQQIEVCLTLV